MEDYVIAEEYTLPSKGLVYNEKINPVVKIRSMTTQEEMKRLSHTNLPYKLLSEIIDDCLIQKPGIPTYDLCVADYQFLLHKLRVVTYGSNYKTNPICPVCGKNHEETLDLKALEVIEFSNKDVAHLSITLPLSKNKLKLRMQTPRMLDEIRTQTNEYAKKHPDAKGDPAFLFTLMSVIESVDGEVLDDVKLESFVRKLPMKDSNFILKSLEKLDFGIKSDIMTHCPYCGSDYSYIFPITREFFGPSIDD